MKLRGKVKGQTIVFDEPLHLLEGLSVEIEIRPIEAVDLERYGIKTIPLSDYVVTNEMVNQIRDDLDI